MLNLLTLLQTENAVVELKTNVLQHYILTRRMLNKH